MKVTYQDVACMHCGSMAHVVRYGQNRGVPRWRCKKCRRMFADNCAMPGMRTPVVLACPRS